MKYILLVSLVFLSGCFGLFESEETATWLVLSDTENFSILVPDSWENLPSDDIPVPNTGQTVLAMKSQNEVAGYYNNLIILESENAIASTSQALMSSTKTMLEKNLTSFNLISQDSFQFSDEETWTMLVFNGRYNTATPSLYYVQTAKVCGDTSYFLTISVGSEQESYDRYAYVLQTFQCN